MTFPIDQFTSLPPAANAQPKATGDVHNDRSYSRADQGAQDVRDIRADTTHNARDLADERSDFQRHLDGQTSNEYPEPTEAPEDRREVSAPGDNDQDDQRGRSDEDSNHGYNVSDVAREKDTTQGQTAHHPGGQTGANAVSPDAPSSAGTTQVEAVSKGETVRAVASSKVTPVATDTGTGTGAGAGPGDTTEIGPVAAGVAADVVTGSEPMAAEPQTAATTPAPSAQDGETAPAEQGNHTNAPLPTSTSVASSAASEEQGTTNAPPSPPSEVTEQANQPADGAAQKTKDVSGSTPAAENIVAPATPETELKFNENAQKTENADHPGWGVQNVPGNSLKTQARDLKSSNAALASARGTETSGVAPDGPSPDTSTQQAPSNIAAGEPSPGTAEEGTAEPGEETSLAEALTPGQASQDQAATPRDTIFGAPVTTGDPRTRSNDAATTGRATAADVNSVAGPGTAKGVAGANTQASPQSGGQANAQSGTTGQTAAQANANAAANASPTAIARAQATGQGGMASGSTPSSAEVDLALASIDKRGTRQGIKPDVGSGSSAAEATGKAKAGTQSSPGLVGQTTNTAATNQASQSQAGQNAATQSQPSKFGQTPAAPVMPDPSILASGPDMSMARGGASMEIDPVTGALHMTGTGSAKMAGPNLSEVTMQFSRARMIQTPAKDIAVQIAKHLSGGVNRFDIRISPPEMGRIEVRLEITDGGKVTAHLVADKPETLDLLQKDRATLEKALAEAGLDTDADTLNFSMREGKDNNDDEGFKNHGLEVADEASDGHGPDVSETLAELEVSAYGFDIVRMKRLDISI